LIAPVRFRAVASGLIIESVCSMAIPQPLSCLHFCMDCGGL
jgi:hypothetical protein